MRLLVVGCGSIGKRHLGNFQALGVEHLGAVDTREDRRVEVAERFGVTSLYGSVDDALAEGYNAVLAGVPTRFHSEVAEKAIASGAHVLVEKPLADRADGVEDLLEKARRNGLVVMVGYTYRFWPPLVRAKQAIDEGAIGRVVSAQIRFSEYLPDWHPWEDYRSWFMADAELGGGALLDESHTVDIARWFFGDVRSVFGFTGRVSGLEITADDLAEMVLRFESGAVAGVHMDIYGRSHRKEMLIQGEDGNLDWDFYANRVTLYRADSKATDVWEFDTDRNEMFLAEARHFLECVEGRATPPVDGADGLETLKVLLAVRRSSQTGRVVELGAGA